MVGVGHYVFSGQLIGLAWVVFIVLPEGETSSVGRKRSNKRRREIVKEEEEKGERRTRKRNLPGILTDLNPAAFTTSSASA